MIGTNRIGTYADIAAIKFLRNLAGDAQAVRAGGYPVRINEELETIAFDPFGGTLKGSFTAHPHLDPESGEMHAICSGSSRGVGGSIAMNASTSNRWVTTMSLYTPVDS